jgi:hypothetical protein
MATKDLREKYAASTTKQAINRAIRAELVGGAEALDALERCNQFRRQWRTAETIGAVEMVQAIVAAMEAEIRRRYEMPGAEE